MNASFTAIRSNGQVASTKTEEKTDAAVCVAAMTVRRSKLRKQRTRDSLKTNKGSVPACLLLSTDVKCWLLKVYGYRCRTCKSMQHLIDRVKLLWLFRALEFPPLNVDNKGNPCLRSIQVVLVYWILKLDIDLSKQIILCPNFTKIFYDLSFQQHM